MRSPENNQDKTAWCEHGAALERSFVSQGDIAGWGVAVNPAKHSDPYTHDLLAVVPVDLKTVKTGWRKSKELFGIDPDWAVSINVKDFVRYGKLYPNILIVVDAQFSEVSRGRYSLTVQRARWLIGNGRAHKHSYQDRVGDAVNAKDSYVFDLRDFDRLAGAS